MSRAKAKSLRNPADFYPTPPTASMPFLKRIKFELLQTILEPAAGDWALVDCIKDAIAAKPISIATCEIREGTDYFEFQPPANNFDLIITNPPYSLAQEFIEKAHIDAKTICMLLRLNYLGSQKRRTFWQMYPPTHLYVLSKRPSFTGNGTDCTEYAWFCWGEDIFRDVPGIYVL